MINITMNTTRKRFKAIGLMSGTSCDGIDVAAIETDGYDYAKPLDFITVPYDEKTRTQIRSCFGRKDADSEAVKSVAELLTLKHADAVRALLVRMGAVSEDFEVCGFHGQTIYHAPGEGITVQIGDGGLLSRQIGMDVVYDFRSADVAAGGEGAPLASLYHKARALSSRARPPFVILNVGGVANVTWIGEGPDDILAFDTGPGNALMDDYVQTHNGARFDEDGLLAKNGQIIDPVLKKFMKNSFFKEKPPKSLDRDEWDIAALGEYAHQMGDVPIKDAMATLMAFTVEGVLKSVEFMPETPKNWYVCGGGRHNKTLMNYLGKALRINGAGALHDVSVLGWDGDATEAECFAYLAVRNLLGEPISVPGTTGVSKPLTGGVLCRIEKETV